MTVAAVATVAEKSGQSISVRATVWPRGRASEGLAELKDPAAKAPPVITLLVEARLKNEPGGFKALVHGYGCSVGEEVELWEKQGLVVIGLGTSVMLVDAKTGALKQRIPTGGYFNSLCVPDDGRDVFVCGDEQVIRVVPGNTVGWQKQLGVDGVVVHRAVGPTVFVSAQRRVGGPWVDFLLDRTTGNVVEAPEGDDDVETAPAAQKPAAPRAQTTQTPSSVKSDKAQNVQRDTDRADDEEDDAAVRMVRDDETDPDDE